MNTQIEREFDFQACVYFQNNFLINSYWFDLVMEVNTESIHEQNVAMERLKYLIHDLFDNSIFVSVNDSNTIQKYTNAGLKVCVIPEEPFDQIISLVILLKTNAICENKIKVTDISLISKLSDKVKFIENIETAQNAIKNDGWWNDPSPNLCIKSPNKKEKIVKLIKNEWSDLGLSWTEKKFKSTEVLFTINPKNKPK